MNNTEHKNICQAAFDFNDGLIANDAIPTIEGFADYLDGRGEGPSMGAMAKLTVLAREYLFGLIWGPRPTIGAEGEALERSKTDGEKIQEAALQISGDLLDDGYEEECLVFEKHGYAGEYVTFHGEVLWDDVDCGIPWLDPDENGVEKQEAETQEEVTDWLRQKVMDFAKKISVIAIAIKHHKIVKVVGDERTQAELLAGENLSL